MIRFRTVVIIFFLFMVSGSLFAQTKDLLSAEEILWLQSRNNTIVVYPTENNPPYSYKNSAGNPQGLSIDYLELIAGKIGVKIEYLTPRSRSQIIFDVERGGKGDVVATITPEKDKEPFLVFTENYITSPTVIVVRKDYNSWTGLNLNDFNGKRLALVKGSSLESYVRTNYPRIIIEETIDDEISLQQVVLGETDAAVMDVASLSYFLSKQILSSVKVAGNTGFEYKPAFGIPKDKIILQSILEKGLSEISANERSLLADKWITLPGENIKNSSILYVIEENFNIAIFYLLLSLCIIGIIILLIRSKQRRGYFRRLESIGELKAEVSDLEKINEVLAEEIKEVKAEEDRILGKIDSFGK